MASRRLLVMLVALVNWLRLASNWPRRRSWLLKTVLKRSPIASKSESVTRPNREWAMVPTKLISPRLSCLCFLQELEGGRRAPTERPGPYGHWSLCNLHVPSSDDVCLSSWTNPFASTTNRGRVIFYHEGLLVGSVPCLRSLPAVVALPYRLNL